MKGIEIIGAGYSEDKELVLNSIKKLSPSRKSPSILLYHSPLALEELQTAGIGLQLAGHTHYRQIFPLSLLVGLAYQHSRGFHSSDGSSIYISPGTSTWGPSMRLGSRSEITLLEINPG